MRISTTSILVAILCLGLTAGCGDQAGDTGEVGTDTLAMDADTAGIAADQGHMTVQTQQQEPYGQYLTDAQGRALYMFTADAADSSSCYDACANAWPPLTVQQGQQPQVGPNVQEAMLGTIERQNGETQVTYNGMPLYYYVKDQGSGQVQGQDVHGFDGEWYLVSPQGEQIEATAGGGSGSS